MKINWTVVIVIIILTLLITIKVRASDSETDAMVSIYLNGLQKAFGTLSSAQQKLASQIISSFIANGDRDWAKLSYILATAWHESRLQLIKEIRAKPGTDLYERQNSYWNTGFYGRGPSQLTHEENYKKLGDRIGVDLVSNPDKALDPRYAADILVIGMMEGLFTGKDLGDYINPSYQDYYNARRVVNGTDRAQLIADHTTTLNRSLQFQIV